MRKLLGDRRPLLIGLFLIALTVVAFWQTLDHDFVKYDDDMYVLDNTFVQAGLTKGNIVWAFSSTLASNWHPLTWISHMLDVQLYGTKPKGHHLTNLLFHLANVLLLFLLLSRMTGSLWRSAFVAVLFGIHPLHVESVAWVSERKDVLSTFFWLLTMLAYVWYVRRPAIGRYLLVVLLFALGLMSKPMLVTLPFVLLLMDYWPLNRLAIGQSRRSTLNTHHSSLNHLLLEKVPLFVLCAASSVVTYIVQQRTGAVSSLEKLPFGERVANAFVAYVGYIVKMIWPQKLAIFYPHPLAALPTLEVVGAALLLALVTVVVIRARHGRPYLPVGWLWYLATLVPVIGLVQVGTQAMADRYSYVPLIGLFVAIAWGAPELLGGMESRRRIRYLGASAGIVIAALTVCTWSQVGCWHDSVTLFKHAVACTTGNYMAHNNLGSDLADRKKFDEAICHFEEALRIYPNYAMAHGNLGKALAKRGRTEEAIAHLEEALRIDPRFASAHGNLGVILLAKGMTDEAIAHLREAIRIKPNYTEARVNLAIALTAKGKTIEAITQYHEALRIRPDYWLPRNNLAWLFATYPDAAVRKPAEAVRLAEDARARTHGKEPGLLDTLAAAYAAAGRYKDAVATAEKALAMATAKKQLSFANEIRNRLRFYKAGLPFYEKPRGRSSSSAP